MISIRGRILTGTVISTKMHRTLIIRREYLHFIPKYARYEKRHTNLAAHVSPAFRVEEGDQVTVGQCRPLSKTVCLHFLWSWGVKYELREYAMGEGRDEDDGVMGRLDGDYSYKNNDWDVR
jgi:ribosomal protein S17